MTDGKVAFKPMGMIHNSNVIKIDEARVLWCLKVFIGVNLMG